MSFIQRAPELQNTFSTDPHLQKALAVLPAEVKKAITPHLQEVGELAVTTWLKASQEAEDHPPTLTHFDAFGNRVDHITLSQGWRFLEAEAARHGIVASGYERRYGEHSRVYQAMLLYLFHSSSAFVSCPLAMTDGAARALELYGDEDLKKRVLPHLISRDPQNFWTSGQWMTERSGGSDVSGTETEAISHPADSKMPFRVQGVKWFTSATTSQMSMLLARTPGAAPGSKGLSLFFSELRDEKQRLQGIEILRLKDKLGTKALPTAELQLTGLPARMVGSEGAGVKTIASLFNITRIYNSLCALSHWRRGLDWARAYAEVRSAFGKRLIDHPLHKAQLDEQEALFHGAFRLTLKVAHLLGKEECGTASEDEKILLRVLTPVTKLYTARLCRLGIGEVMEMFGGLGYMENSRIPTLLRDAQVFSIWEGTTNVLALDFLRALAKEDGARVLAHQLTHDWKTHPAAATALQLLSSPQEKDARTLAWMIAEIAAFHS